MLTGEKGGGTQRHISLVKGGFGVEDDGGVSTLPIFCTVDIRGTCKNVRSFRLGGTSAYRTG